MDEEDIIRMYGNQSQSETKNINRVIGGYKNQPIKVDGTEIARQSFALALETRQKQMQTTINHLNKELFNNKILMQQMIERMTFLENKLKGRND
jgi:hypothetical protein